ncbi:DUF3995 domain-containing protein [Leucobacter zeae]|nr:DUF3995 domain-containing protein [Leucobacter zeae]
MSALTGIARFVGWAGLTSVGALHLVWASGSPWPERSRKRLAEAVVGSSKGMPDPGATALVGGAALVTGAIAGGAWGEGRAAVGVRRLVGAALLARAALGGDAALTALGLPAAGRRFRHLDRSIYRPLCTVLGLAVLVGARSRSRG